jgi:hypothetical protein
MIQYLIIVNNVIDKLTLMDTDIIQTIKQSKRAKQMNRGMFHKIALLCHGRNHKRYGPYFDSALHIDIRSSVNPDIVCDLRNGMPRTPFKFDLIQTVFWPQLHRYRYTASKKGCYSNRPVKKPVLINDEFNMQLLKGIASALKKGGFFVFCHNGYTRRIILICKRLGLTHVSFEHVENTLGLCVTDGQNDGRIDSGSGVARKDKWSMMCFEKKH